MIDSLANHKIYGTLYDKTENTKIMQYIINSWLPTFIDTPISTVIREYKGQYLDAYIVGSISRLYGRDIVELMNFKYSLNRCPIFKKIFKKDGRTNFCPKYSANKKAQKYNDQKHLVH